MTIKDFFWFKKEEYEERIKNRIKYTDERIHKERAEKSRQQYDGCWSIGTGIVCCISSGGLFVGTAVCDYRSKSVSKRKLVLLEKEAERRGMKKYEGRKRDFWVSCISNSVGFCAGCGVDSCVTGMLTQVPCLSVQDVGQITDVPLEAGEGEQAEKSNTVQETDNPSAAKAHAEKQNTRVHGHMLTQVPFVSVQDVGEITDVPLETGEQAETSDTVQETDHRSEAMAHAKKQNTRVHGRDRITDGAENQVSEPQATVHPTSDVQRALLLPGSVPRREGAELGEFRVAVASAQEAETNCGELALEQMASSALDEVGKSSSSTTLADSALVSSS